MHCILVTMCMSSMGIVFICYYRLFTRLEGRTPWCLQNIVVIVYDLNINVVVIDDDFQIG
jgi:hypothetical protein